MLDAWYEREQHEPTNAGVDYFRRQAGVCGTCDNARNLSDDQVRRVARDGGLIADMVALQGCFYTGRFCESLEYSASASQTESSFVV